MATATVHSPAEWNERALELARANHLDGTATYLGKDSTSQGQPGPAGQLARPQPGSHQPLHGRV